MARFEVMLKPAADFEGRTLTDFVMPAMQESAKQASEQANVVRLSMADQVSFAQAHLQPPVEATALKRAFARRSKLLRTE